VKFKRGEVKDWTEDTAVNFFKLNERANERIVVVDWDGSRIKQYESPQEVVREFVNWRLGWYIKRYEKRLTDDSYELRYWQGIKACFDTKLPVRLGKQANKNEIVNEVSKITASFSLDDSQIDKIVSLPTYKWAHDFLSEVTANISSLQEKINDHSAILASPDKIKSIYSDELDALKKIK
jgi:DNA gyrase/topoisomerase IV subunit A